MSISYDSELRQLVTAELFEKEKFKRWRRNIRFAYQRIKYGYCDSDVWSIDLWFLNVMPGMLQQLKDTTHSYPCF